MWLDTHVGVVPQAHQALQRAHRELQAQVEDLRQSAAPVSTATATATASAKATATATAAASSEELEQLAACVAEQREAAEASLAQALDVAGVSAHEVPLLSSGQDAPVAVVAKARAVGPASPAAVAVLEEVAGLCGAVAAASQVLRRDIEERRTHEETLERLLVTEIEDRRRLIRDQV